jgi:hypothetical protein
VEHGRHYRGLNHGHDFTGLGAEYGETYDAVADGLDRRLDKAARLRGCPRSQ